jgi:hypothetical protein
MYSFLFQRLSPQYPFGMSVGGPEQVSVLWEREN